MRIRLFHAFASNNSGSYTIVGSFRDVETAKDVARVLREVSAEHDTWYRDNPDAYAPVDEATKPSPLERFAKDHGLSEEHPGRADDWPEHGNPPAVLTAGRNVVVYADYTVTMPRTYGEYIYRRGGRVSLELEHAHDPIAVEFAFVPRERKPYWDPVEVNKALRLFRPVLDPLLVRLSRPREFDTRAPVTPAWHVDHVPRVRVLFPDLVAGVEEVTRVAHEAGFETHMHLCVASSKYADPFADLRAERKNWGRARVILWTVPEDRIRALRVVRDVAGTTLEGAKAILADLPYEVLVDVDDETAQGAAERLIAEGCTAENFTPDR